MSRTPLAFMSYVNLNDQHDYGDLTQFRERLSGEVRFLTGEVFDIFQDRKDIKWGQQWQERINESLNAVTFLIPIITPSFFKSDACRAELEHFLKREEELGRGDLILPVYYATCPVLKDKEKLKHDSLAQIIGDRQYEDWRELRHEPFTSPQLRKAITKIAEKIVEALEQRQPEIPKADAVKPAEVVKAMPTSKQPEKESKGADSQSNTFQSDGGTQSVAQGNNAIGTIINYYEQPLEPPDKPQPAPAAKTELATVVVDAWHRGDYTIITEALKAVKAGGKILVRPGFYSEGIVMDKPVEIIGDGEQSKIVIEASGKAAVLFKANVGRVANVTLRQAGGGEWFGVDVTQGRLELEDCDISSQESACVAIHGNANPILRRNHIHDGKQGGVVVYDNGKGTLEDNEIFANESAGVIIADGGNPTLRGNRIRDGKESGVFVWKDGKGTLEDNEIFANESTGVVIADGGNPILRRNRITKNGFEGIGVWDKGGGTFEDNDLRGNTGGAWDIAPDCEAWVKRKGNVE